MAEQARFNDPPRGGEAGDALAADERTELEWLRAENTLLRTERDVLLRVATAFAEDADATLLRRAAGWRDHHGTAGDDAHGERR
jgi:hypothetical protein